VKTKYIEKLVDTKLYQHHLSLNTYDEIAELAQLHITELKSDIMSSRDGYEFIQEFKKEAWKICFFASLDEGCYDVMNYIVMRNVEPILCQYDLDIWLVTFATQLVIAQLKKDSDQATNNNDNKPKSEHDNNSIDLIIDENELDLIPF
jgi:hypothetical protein